MLLLLLAFCVFSGFAFAVGVDFHGELVNLSEINPDIIIELKYATTDNFLQKKLYADTTCYLLRVVAEKLDQAQKLLARDGLGLKVYDGYRPLAVQEKMWQLMPKPGYVANPFAGGSHHNRGAAVDLTLVDANGHELEMPTGFDTFTERAHQFSKEPTPTQRANRLLLRMVMEKVGLVPIRTEWWHFQLPDAKKYPIIPSMTQ
jgi:D-alanyl-D-alanine dipeptidase